MADRRDFNPRSQAGATCQATRPHPRENISIHAPKRERPDANKKGEQDNDFNPRSQAGATAYCKYNMPNFMTFQEFNSTFLSIDFNLKYLQTALQAKSSFSGANLSGFS